MLPEVAGNWRTSSRRLLSDISIRVNLLEDSVDFEIEGLCSGLLVANQGVNDVGHEFSIEPFLSMAYPLRSIDKSASVAPKMTAIKTLNNK